MELEEVKSFILERTLKMAEKAGNRLPCGTQNGIYHYKDDGGWTGGFNIGLLNYCYLLSGDSVYLEYADKPRFRLTDRLKRNTQSLDHDVGFLYLPSEYARYKLRGDNDGMKNTVLAAEWLCKRYNPNGRFIRAWNKWGDNEFGRNNEGRIIIDCMYNLPILFITAKYTGDKKFYEIAENHAETCLNTIVRPNGTTYHTYVFDPKTGKPKFGQTFQGYADDSCWSRGQAWAVGGFAMAYAYTGRKEFLEASKKTAKVFLDNLEDNYLPKWDFSLKGRKDMPIDASAAVICSSGLLELSKLCENYEAMQYRAAAIRLAEAVWEHCALKNGEDSDGLITGCTGFYNENAEVNQNLIFGDYYFVETIAMLLGIEKLTQ